MKLPEDVKTAYMEQIDRAAQLWRDDVFTYGEFRKDLENHSCNLFFAGARVALRLRDFFDFPDSVEIVYDLDLWKKKELNIHYLKGGE